jgi:hypothetical protein
MDAKYFRDRAETCLRLAKELPWNNPGRFHLMDKAENLQRRAANLEAQEQHASPQISQPTHRHAQQRQQPKTRRT